MKLRCAPPVAQYPATYLYQVLGLLDIERLARRRRAAHAAP